MKASAWARWLPLVAVVASLAVAYPRLVTGSGVPVSDDVFVSDLLDAELPARVADAREVGRGPATEWLPRALARGEPLGTLLFATLTPARALDLYLLVLLATLGLGAAALARRLGATDLGAALAGLVLAHSGFAVCQLHHPAELACVALFPWALWLLDGALARHRDEGLASAATLLAAFALVFGEQLLCGFPQTAYYSALACGAYVVLRLVAEATPWRARISFFALFVGAGLAGAAVGAASLWPMHELAAGSNRAHALSLAFVDRWPMAWRELAAFAWPFPAGDPSRGTYLVAAPFSEDYVYAGLLAMPLALAALASRATRRIALVLGAIGVVAVLFALGTKTPLFPLAFRLVPGIGLFRFPQRALFVAEVALAVVAGLGLTSVEAFCERLRRSGKLRLAPRLVASMLLVAGAADVLLENVPLNTIDDATRWIDPPPTVAFLPAARPLRTYTPKWIQLHRVARRTAGGWASDELEPYLALRRLLPADVGLLWGIETVDPYAGLASEGRVRIFGDQFGPGLVQDTFRMPQLDRLDASPAFHRLLALHGVADVLTPATLDAPGFTLVHDEPGARIYRVDGAFDRVRLVSRARGVADVDAALRELVSDTFDPSRSVLLAGAPPQDARIADDASVRLQVERADERGVTAHTSSATPTWLVTTDESTPSLVATIDGRPAPVLTADVDLPCVAVPPGEHEVALFDDARAAKAGAAVTLAAALVLAALALFLERRRRLYIAPSRG